MKLKKNEYNLNIPRYVDTFEEEEPVDWKKLRCWLKMMKILEIQLKIAEQLAF